MKRKEILRAQDFSFIHHGEYSKELPKRNFTGARYTGLKFTSYKGVQHYTAMFNTRSAEDPQGQNYDQPITLLGLRPILQDKKKKMLLRDAVLKSIAEGEVLVGCDCPAFLYWGYRYIDTQKGIIDPKYKEKRAPNVRNPKRRGIICKHLNLVMTVLPFNASSIVKDLKSKELKK